MVGAETSSVKFPGGSAFPALRLAFGVSMQRFGVEIDEFELKIFNLTVYLPCIFMWFLARIYRVFDCGCSHSYYFIELKPFF